MKKSSVCLWTILLAATALYPSIITFDDIPDADPQSDWSAVPNGYGGLNWDRVFLIHKDYSNEWMPGSGFDNGLVSGDWVGYNLFAEPATVSSTDPFLFNGAYFTGAYNNGLSIDVTGFRNDVAMYTQTVTVSTGGPTWFDFGYSDIDKLTLSSYGGTNYLGQGNELTHFVMDNFTINETGAPANVPEPGTLVLLTTGLLFCFGVARKRA